MKILLTLYLLKSLSFINAGYMHIDEEFLIGVSLFIFLVFILFNIKSIITFLLFLDINTMYTCFFLLGKTTYNLYLNYYLINRLFLLNISYFFNEEFDL